MSYAQHDLLRMVIAGEPTTLDWGKAQSSEESYVLMNVMQGLVELDESLMPKPMLAHDWFISKDGTRYVFNLKPGVKWSDGKPLVAEDFVYSWRRLADPSTGSAYSNFLSDVRTVKALSQTSLEVTLKRPVPYFLNLLTFWVTFPMRADLVRKHGSRWSDPDKIVTLGPYQISAWLKKKSLLLIENSRYHGTKPLVKKVELLLSAGSDGISRAVDEGSVDLIVDAGALELLRAGKTPTSRGWTQRQFLYLGVHFLGFNLRNSIFADVSARKAVASAIDRERLTRDIGRGDIAAGSLVPPGLMGYNANMGMVYNLPQARELSRQAHLPTTIKLLTRREPRLQQSAQTIATMLGAALGMSVTVDSLASDDYISAVKSGRFDLIVGSWGADYPDPASFMDLMFSPTNKSRTGWVNKSYDALIKNANDSIVPTERAEYYKIAQDILIKDEAALVPLYYPKTSVMVGPRIKELYIDPMQYIFFSKIKQ